MASSNIERWMLRSLMVRLAMATLVSSKAMSSMMEVRVRMPEPVCRPCLWRRGLGWTPLFMVTSFGVPVARWGSIQQDRVYTHRMRMRFLSKWAGAAKKEPRRAAGFVHHPFKCDYFAGAAGVSGAAGAAVPPAGAAGAALCLAVCFLLCFSTQVLIKASILSSLTCCFSAFCLHISSADLPAAKVEKDTPDIKAAMAVNAINFFMR